MTPRQRLLLRLPRLRVFPKRRRSAQTPENARLIERNPPGKLIPVGKDNYTPVVLNFFGDLGTSVSFALSTANQVSSNLELYRNADGTGQILPGTSYSALALGMSDPRGGITTLYVQAKQPDAVIGDSQITATMSPQGNGATPSAHDLGTAYDVVVSWEDGTGPNGATLDDNPNGGGKRVFPEKETPTGAVKNVVNVVFETVPLNLGHAVTGYVKRLDPDNYAYDATTAWQGDDNNWKKSSGVREITIPANGIRTTSGTIEEAYAGDNWILLASASQARVSQSKMDDSSKANRYTVITTAANGDDIPANRSDMLTVWRTLWMETDAVPGAGGLDSSLLKQEMLNACIRVEDLDYFLSVISTDQMFVIYGKDAQGKPIILDQNITIVLDGSKDCPVSSSPSFWYFQAVAADSIHITGGKFDVNTIYTLQRQ